MSPFNRYTLMWAYLRLIYQRFMQSVPPQHTLLMAGRPLAAGLLSCLLLIACGRDKEAVVQAKVAERVQAFRVKQLNECRAALFSDAEKRVDSLLLAEAKGLLTDSLTRLKPSKPAPPPLVAPIDSLSVQPIFDTPPGN